MTGIRRDERDQLKVINGLGISSRDGPGSATQTRTQWPNTAPVPVKVPVQNPYGAGRMRDNLQSSNRRNNRTASTTILGPLSRSIRDSPSSGHPNKRPRLSEDSEFVFTSREFSTEKRMHSAAHGMKPLPSITGQFRIPSKPSTTSTPAASRIRGATASSSEPIVIVDDDADIQAPKQSPMKQSERCFSRTPSPDPIDSFPIREPSRLQRRNSPPHAFEAGPSNPESHRLADDGESTKRLRERLFAAPSADIIDVDAPGVPEDDELDSIRSFSEHTPPKASHPIVVPDTKSLPPHRVVKERVAAFEQKTRVKTPYIDLNAQNSKGPTRKSAMKPKGGKSGTVTQSSMLDHMTMLPSGFVHSSSTKSPKRTVKTAERLRDEFVVLPLEAWTLGRTLIQDWDEDVHYPRYWLVYTERPNPVLRITDTQNSSTPLNGAVMEEIKVGNGVEKLCYTMTPCDIHNTVVLQFKSRRHQTTNTEARYVPGSAGADGSIMFKFLTKHANWENGTPYAHLVKVMEKMSTGCEVRMVDAHGSKRVWEAQMNAVEFPDGLTDKLQHVDIQEQSGANVGPTDSSIPVAKESEGPVTRRSTRTAASESSSPAPDELILVYPPSGVGAININKSDLKRLDPDGYLNDTLIEFGLKLWLADLTKSNPDLAEQIHVFNSFFYKKLNVKDKDEGYQSVRKWTSKFDIFKKKFIIVPINERFHWYLAIIYHPEHVLLPPLNPTVILKPMTRKRKRQEEPEELMPTETAAVVGSKFQSPDHEIIPDSCPPSRGGSPVADSEGEREVESLLERTRSCSLEDQPMADEEDVAGAAAASMGEMIDLELQYPASPQECLQQIEVDSDTPHPEEANQPTSFESADGAQIKQREHVVDANADIMASVGPATFYGNSSASSSARKGVRTPTPTQFIVDDDNANAPEDEVMSRTSDESSQHTYIFTFDSLGTRHPQAIKTLTQYLQMEARDKKGIEVTREVMGRNALVPMQPNYWDCGIYVLHFVRMFLSDPDAYFQLITAFTKQKDYSAEERAEHWKASHVNVKRIREELKERIAELSETWKSDRALREEQRKREAEASAASLSDEDEVIIEDVTHRKAKSHGKGRAS
ncbi:cysteine proteinase [Laetiporus sulphureus 93-53]|uniref:Cysteine proteinase n=1 Tax=Laetiporus sulphureus 93-53 TaxID=1314785 RepID=A0A165FQ65_9APHY|nr:cysteine proteinase [Laetiporus sulphureus 93-53]KZT09310.1 cysteine proteinase [Laetiporus sulphureus 93-53]